MSFIDFSTYERKWKCYRCSNYTWYNFSVCKCDPIYILNRLRVAFDEPTNKDTNYEVSIESGREVLSTLYASKWDIAVENAHQFNMSCNTELSADDETTVFEPHIDFFETFFGIKDLINKMRRDIIFVKKTSKGKVDKELYAKDIDIIRQTFEKNAISLCEYSHQHDKLMHMLLNKIIHIILNMRIISLFDDDQKPNAHVSRKKGHN